MHEHDKVNIDLRGKKRILLVGNPNVGKSVVFAILTGRYVTVSNYPGTTVEVTTGLASFDRSGAVVTDTPGINSLLPHSEDEKVTRDILLDSNSSIIVQVADAKNLHRTIVLTLQLLELGVPVVLDLNMFDEAEQRGIRIDVQKLSELLGIDVVQTVATEKRGTNRLIHVLGCARSSRLRADYPKEISSAVEQITELLPENCDSKTAVALFLLCRDESIIDWLKNHGAGNETFEKIQQTIADLELKFHRSLSSLAGECRRRKAEEIVRVVQQVKAGRAETFREKMGRLMVSPVYGVPIVLAVLYLLYEFVGKFGAGTLVDLLETYVFGTSASPSAGINLPFGIHIPFGGINWYLALLINKLHLGKFMAELLVGEYGLVTMAATYAVAIILPIVSTFFIAFGVLEDSGYLPRLAAMVNRIFKRLGMSGKAVLPMVLGLGCGTMATLTTRVLEGRKEKIIATLLLALAVPCSAQLGVIMAMLGNVSVAATMVWVSTLIGIILLVGFLASKILPGAGTDFILELPPIRAPQISNILAKVGARIEWYLKEAVPLFLLGTLILFVSDKVGLLVLLEKLASPVVVSILGLPVETTQAFLIGFLRRDYGTAGLYMLQKSGKLDTVQVLVSVVTITLFIPCIAQFFVTVRERGVKVALGMLAFIFPFAVMVGGLLNLILRHIRLFNV
jgi:ferrous iron transport protein B